MDIESNYEANPYQLEVLGSEAGFIFLGGGVGVGKTDTGSLWMGRECNHTPEGVIHLIAANTYPQLFDSTLRNLFKNWDAWGFEFEPTELPRSRSPINVRVWNGELWVEILCRSLDHYESLAGIEVGVAWLDELWQTKREAFDLVTARCRDNRVKNRVLCTTTLEDPSHWMYERFVDNLDPERDLALYVPTVANAHNLPDGYIDNLRRSYPPKRFERDVMARWVSLDGGQVYYAFDRGAHVSEDAEWEKHLPVIWSHDFNIGQGKPMSSCLLQIKKGQSPAGEWRPELHVFDEIVIETSDTNDAIEEFEGFGLEPERVTVCGDASGRAKDTRSKTTDYDILRRAGYTNQRVPKANPPIRTRHNTVNALLKNAEGDVRLKVHPRCKVMAKGLETVKLRDGAQYLELETFEQHVTTALGYAACEMMPMRTPIRPGQNRPLVRVAR